MPADATTVERALESLSSDALRDSLRPVMQAAVFRGVISYAEAQRLCEQEKITMAELMLAVVPAATTYSKPPISKFEVGAVAQGSTTGSLYFGANMEFVGAALSFTIHAEQSAVTNAWINGEQGISQLAISEAPCGYCRQFLWEITTAETMAVLLTKGSSGPLARFLPEPFGPKDLGVQGALMSPADHGLALDSGTPDPVMLAALAAANASYAPPQYSASYAGVAVYTEAGEIFAGRHAENAAFNPSMSPLESALVMWNFATHGTDPVRRVVLVQIDGAVADQTSATAALVESFARTGPVVFDVYGAHPA